MSGLKFPLKLYKSKKVKQRLVKKNTKIVTRQITFPDES